MESYSVCFLQTNLLYWTSIRGSTPVWMQFSSAVLPFLAEVLHFLETLYVPLPHLHLFSLPRRDNFLHCYLLLPTESQLAYL